MMQTMLINIKKFLKCIVPFVCITGTVPHYILIWLSWRTLTLFCPKKEIYQSGDDILYSCYQRLMIFFFEHSIGTKIYLHGDAVSLLCAKENVIYISNHQCTMDWMVADMLALRQGSEGHLRYLMKSTLQILPIYGFYLHQHGCIYVKRGNFNINKMRHGLQYLSNKKIHSWLVIFPEGTRFNPDNEDLLQEHRMAAQENDFQPLKHLLMPKPRGFQLAIRDLAGNIDAIYDATIFYSDTYDPKKKQRIRSPSIFDFISLNKPEIHIHAKRINVKEIPHEGDEDFKFWLMNLFIEKDRLLDQAFNKDIDLLRNEGISSKLPVTKTLPAVIFFGLLTVPFVMTKFGRSLYWKTWIFGTFAGYFYFGLRAVA